MIFFYFRCSGFTCGLYTVQTALNPGVDQAHQLIYGDIIVFKFKLHRQVGPSYSGLYRKSHDSADRYTDTDTASKVKPRDMSMTSLIPYYILGSLQEKERKRVICGQTEKFRSSTERQR